MKQLVIARIAAAASLVSLAAGLVPMAAHGQTTVNANWVQVSNTGPAARGGAGMVYDSARQRSILFGGSDGSGSYFSDTWQYDGASWTQLQVAGPSARFLALMAYNSARGVTVLYGGYNNGVINNTWEWNGSSWTQRLTAHTPPARLWSAMTYDSTRHVIVLFGGELDTLLNDTWQYDGNDWTQVITAHAPAARRGHAIAYDPARGVTVLFGGQSSVNLNDTWEFNGVDWTQVAPASSPSERIWPAMAYDPNLGGTVMFGGAFGSNYNPLNDTWLYAEGGWQQIAPQVNLSARFYSASAYESNRGDFVLFGGSVIAGGGSNFGDTWSLQGVTTSALDWTQATTSTAPTARVWSQMDYDSARGVSVLFGGSSDSGPGNLHDTWEWDGARWTQMAPATSPPPVAGGMMAYDSTRGVSVLFGGSGSTGSSSSTWEWDGTNWTQKSPATSPPARLWAAMTYDSARSRMVLFGGDGPNGLLGDTWTYDGSTWTQMKSASSPTQRDGPAMAFDPARGRAVLFGGHDSNGRLGDTWEWDGANWTQIPVTVAPHTRFWESLAFDTQRGKTILFGGDHVQPNDLGESNDTWEWDGAQWTHDFPAAAPPIRSGQSMAYDATRGRMVIFGGWNAATSPATIYGDTWELGNGIQTPPGTPSATLNVFGLGTNFGSVNVGSAADGVAAFMLSSSGTGPLAVNSIALSGPSDFVLSTDCPMHGDPLPAGSYCMAIVSFTPTAAGTRTAGIAFSYNAPGGNQTFQLQGTGVVHPTTLTVSPATAMFNGGAIISASLQVDGKPFAGQPVTLSLLNGPGSTTQTDSSGIAVWFGVSFAGIHAGTYPTGIQARFAGSPAYAPSSTTAALVITQPVTTTYTGEFYVADITAGHVTIQVDQRTPASDPQFIDYAQTPVWVRVTLVGAAASSDFWVQVTDASNWSTTGFGVATAPLPALADGGYTVVAALVDGPSSTSPGSAVSSDDTRTGLVSSPTKGGYLSAGGAIATDPSTNTGDRHGYFSLQMKPGKPPVGNLVYSYRVRMDVGGGNLRDVDVWVTSTSITTLNGNSATGQFVVEYVDALTGQRYTTFEFSGGTFKLTFVNATGNSPAKFGLVLKHPDGTVFHSTGSAPSPVVVGRLVSTL
ncbi:MAG: choice-of-anchor D domain-containing protein [Chloroflexi bacterium]|nr:MAG: choice-of-anchor D domain-containing protein [Chloroflexota bacterium]